MSDFLDSLNQQQMYAVLHTDGALLILAGAGTGKTKVLTSRIANIISRHFVSPNNILAVTFTNKAAKEMHERVNSMIDCFGLNIGTFHSIAAKILRQEAHYLNNGINSRFSIITPDDQIKVIKDILKQENFDSKRYIPKVLQTIISRWKDQNLLPYKLSDSDITSQTYRVAQTIYNKYQRILQDSNLVDFGDLLVYNNEIFMNNPSILEYYQNQFQYILIDEYQDTNVSQYLWAMLLAKKSQNICCVGDDDQSIYGWRGAEIGNILRFERDFPNSKVIKLEQNYRSSSEILSAARSIINNNQTRHNKSLWTDKINGEKIKIISCRNDKEEARFTICEIKKLIESGKYSASSIAILVRAGSQTRTFEQSFILNAVPYKIIGGLRFYDRMEIRDILSYIRITLNHSDNVAFERIINVPRRSIGGATLDNVKKYAIEHNVSMFDAVEKMLKEALFKGRAKENLDKLIKNVHSWGERYATKPPFDVTKLLLEESGYLAMLKEEKTDESLGRIENINEFLRTVAQYKTIEQCMEHASLLVENDILESNLGGTVSIMTLHAAKGLEFDLVFLPGWEEGLLPHQRSLTEEGPAGLEEERRLAYVGITRARKDLYITYAESRFMFFEVTYPPKSRFISEIPKSISVQSSYTIK